MIYIFLILIIGIYFYLLFKNIGETEKIVPKSYFIIFLIILFTTTLFFVYIPKSHIQDMDEYERILTKNENIRANIIKIKKSIPKLEKKLENNPAFFEGWLMLARSYSIIDNLNASISAYEKALLVKSDNSKALKEYLNVLRVQNNKKNKEKIIKIYDQLVFLDKKDASILLNKLHYSVKINDSQLTIKTLNEIINHPEIIDKNRYKKILMKINNNE